MKEQDIVDLGFKRVDVTAEESGDDAFYYYTYDFGNGTLSLISNANNEVIDGRWGIEIFEDETIQFWGVSDLKKFINVIKKNTI
jgi:hypothetical protein